ncbi:hypothetical protein [Arthrobacter castelli]|uniref:hypothetical protein n=1 Tax=Arthrobacter castelli TaxID=271431 RepID=UPI00040D8E54|nr:hypothetical protein [Arthrobacter castelli]
MTRTSAGVLIVLTAVIWQGVGTAVVGLTVGPSESTVVTFAAFATAALISAAARLTTRGIGDKSTAPKMSWREVLLLNLVTVGAFGTFYVAATLVPPTAASVTEFSIAPLLVALLSGAPRRQFIQPILILTIAAIIVTLTISGTTAEPGPTSAGIALAVVAGAGAAGVLLTSRHLTQRGFSALQIAVSRFHLTWALTAMLAIPTILGSDPQDLMSTAAIGVLCIGLPILLLQWGITICPPLPAALLLTMVPAVVWFSESAFTLSWSPGHVPAMCALVAVAVLGTLHSSSNRQSVAQKEQR